MKAGYGKTLLMLSLADKCSKLLKVAKGIENVEIFTSIGKHDSQKVIKKLKENSIYFEDEDPFIAGTDSVTTEHALINVQEVAFRFTSITYLTAAVTKKRLPKNFFACILEPIMRNDYERKTLCRVISGVSLLPLGHIVVNLLPETDPLLLKHSIKEKQYKNRMLMQGGMESIAIDPKELEIKSKRLLEYITGYDELILNNLTDKEKKTIRKLSIERIKTAMSKLAYELSGSSHQQKRIIDECWDHVMKFKIEIDVELEIKKEKEKKSMEKQKEIEKQKEQQKKQLDEKQKEIEQLDLIQIEVDSVINEFRLIENKNDKDVSKLLIKHDFLKRGIDKEYLNYALGELEYKVYTAEKLIIKEQKEKIKLYEVDDNNKFIFQEAKYLDNLRTSKMRLNKRLKVSWDTLVNIYQDKKNGLLIQELAKKHNISGGSVINYLKVIKGKIADELGLQYEQFRANQLEKLEYNTKEWKVLPAKINSKDPDITVKHRKKQIEYYYSLKIRNLNESKATEVLEFKKKFAPELNSYLKARKKNIESKIFIDFYNLYNNTQSCIEINSGILENINNITVLLKWTGEIELKRKN